MGKLNFYVLWSVSDAPRQFISKSSRRCFQVHIPLPLPQHLVIFGLGAWKSSETEMFVDVVVSAEVPTQRIGTLSAQTRCLIWEGDWNADIATMAAERSRRGVYGKIILSMCGEEEATVYSSTPLVQRRLLFTESINAADLSSTLQQSHENETVTADSHLADSVCYGDIQVNKIDTSDSTVGNTSPVFPVTSRRTVISKRGRLTWSSEDMDSLVEDIDQASISKKKRLSRMNSLEEMTVQIKRDSREACPSERWSHTMCLSDPDTAVLIGGEMADENVCGDSLWKLEIDNDFWFPLNSTGSGPMPPCARGHTATYDPDSKSIFVYGGLRDGQRYSDLYILSTVTWKWKLVNAKGNVPSLAYHSAAFYKKELFVFGGVHQGHSSGDKPCSNSLYIFNPEDKLWYQPIVEGDRPLPRFGHSATLMSQQLIIFGGRKTATYLNDLHVLDLVFMEYTAVKFENTPPLPRGFHTALPVSDTKLLISGGCSAIGALQDIHIFSIDTNTWSSIASPLLCSKPRAGHSMISLGCSILNDAEKRHRGETGSACCTLLVFGGSDCCGSFYNDSIKCMIEIPGEE